jgi:riboflavin kinase/FMN adenylyltransferase
VDALIRYGADRGFSVVPHELVSMGGTPITSTRIRGLIAAGDVSGAALLLGRPHRVRGTVHRGRGAGAEIGFATANLSVDPYIALPAPGVYAGRVEIDATAYAVAVSVGVPPTFPGAVDDFEVHVIGFQGDLYGRGLTVEFLERLREQRAFETTDQLAAAIDADVARTVEINSR